MLDKELAALEANEEKISEQWPNAKTSPLGVRYELIKEAEGDQTPKIGDEVHFRSPFQQKLAITLQSRHSRFIWNFTKGSRFT